jgi:hypothetical protein
MGNQKKVCQSPVTCCIVQYMKFKNVVFGCTQIYIDIQLLLPSAATPPHHENNNWEMSSTIVSFEKKSQPVK